MNLLSNQLIAQVINNPVLGPSLQTLSGTGFLAKFLPALVTLGFVIGVVIFLFMLITGAISWITSGGDKVALDAAKKRVTNAIIGVFILLSIFAITNLIQIFFKTNILQFQIGPGALEIGGGAPPGNGGNGMHFGNPNCPCSAAFGGGCATTGQIAIGPGGDCYRCTATRWVPIGGSCSPITCPPCP